MSILVDTSVWSEVLRKKKDNSRFSNLLNQLILDGLISIIGPIRQELLSGIPDRKKYDLLKEKLSYFPDIRIETEDYEQAATFFNTCRSKGVQGSHIDFLICAMACKHNLQILTSDKDFDQYSRLLPIELYEVG